MHNRSGFKVNLHFARTKLTALFCLRKNFPPRKKPILNFLSPTRLDLLTRLIANYLNELNREKKPKFYNAFHGHRWQENSKYFDYKLLLWSTQKTQQQNIVFREIEQTNISEKQSNIASSNEYSISVVSR